MFSMEKRIEKAERGSSRRWHVGLLVAALVVSGSAVAASKKTTAPTAKPSQSVPAVKPNPMTKLKLSVLDMPLSFEVNRGQTDANVKFMTQAQNFTVFLMPGETV